VRWPPCFHERRSIRRSTPLTQSLRYEFAAQGEVWRNLAKAHNIFAANFENAKKAAKCCLRMRERGLAILFRTTRDQCPGDGVEVLIKARQNDRAPWRSRNGRKQPRGGSIRSSGADCDHRPGHGAIAQAAALRFDKRNLAPRSIHEAAFSQNLRPLRDRDIQKIERDPPIEIELRQNERIEPFPSHILDDQLIDEAGKFARQMPGIGGGRRDKKRFARVELMFALRPTDTIAWLKARAHSRISPASCIRRSISLAA